MPEPVNFRWLVNLLFLEWETFPELGKTLKERFFFRFINSEPKPSYNIQQGHSNFGNEQMNVWKGRKELRPSSPKKQIKRLYLKNR